jgi:sigma-B regulation protein RsbU (phosphoserine phosphatase)
LELLSSQEYPCVCVRIADQVCQSSAQLRGNHVKNELDRYDWLDLQDRALAVAFEGITIADARLPGRPLIYVNEGFERLTGFSAAEALGRNCNFLQGDLADQSTVHVMRKAMQEGRECTVEIRNHRKDGTRFWNRLSITPVRDDSRTVTHFIGIQSDVTERWEAEEKLQRANDQMRNDLRDAAVIQKAWLPQSLPNIPGYDFAWQFRPCDELAGDGLHILRLDEHHVGLYVLDVSGHGAPAAMLSASLVRSLSPHPEQSCLYVPDADNPTGFAAASPAQALTTLNRRVSPGPQTGKFFTIIYGILDLRSAEFRYATAGHPPPVRLNAAGTTLCPLAEGIPIGVLPEFEFGEQCVQLESGDRLLIYTDGASEATNADDQDLGDDRMMSFLAETRSLPLAESLPALIAKVEKWCPGGIPQDDITLVALEVGPRS